MPSLTAWRSRETLGKFPASWPMWKPAGGSSQGVRLPKSLMGREGSSDAILACVCFFKAMTWQPVTDYKMAGVHISMWLRQGHRCVWTKAAALHRNTHQLFSVCQCQHICFTMRLSSSLQPSHPCYRLTVGEPSLCLPVSTVWPQASNCTNMPKCHAGIPVPLTPIKTQRGSTILSSRFLLLSNLWKIYKPACCSQRSDLLKATSIIYKERKPDTNASSNKDLSRNYSLWLWADEYLLTPVNTYV